MANKDDLTSEHRLLSMRVPLELYAAIETDAAALHVSLSDAGRMRLRTGSVAAAARTGARAGRAVTAAITGPASQTFRTRGNFSTNALLSGAR